MNRWDTFFYGPVAAVRPYLLLKAALLFLAFDRAVAMLRFGAHYGAAGFNVSHFAWLDRIQPVPTPGWQVAVLLLSGHLALTLVLSGMSRLGMACLWVLYTYSWSMSRLDSYTHHYLITILLAALIFFPDLRGEELCRPGRHAPRVSAWAYALVGATVGIVFFYCAMAKVDSQWRWGHALLSMPGPEQLYGPLQIWLEKFGLTRSMFWAVLASSVIVLELALAVAYLVAVRQDAVASRTLRIGSLVAWVLAMGLHVGNEFLQLDIRWFSYYMILVGCVFFLPEPWLLLLARTFYRTFGHVAAGCRSLWPAEGRLATSLLAVLAAGACWFAGWQIDLPGSRQAGAIAATSVVLVWLTALLRGNRRESDVAPRLFAGGVAALVMWATISCSSARDYFYRYLGDDLVLLGQSEQALAAYRKAVDYAPAEATRLAEVYHNMGTLRLAEGDAEAALQCFRQAADQSPTEPRFRKQLAFALRSASDFPAALAEYQRVIQQTPEDVGVLTELGIVYRRLGRTDEALDHLRRALQLAPADAGAHYNLGNMLLELQRPAQAVDHFRQAAAAEPELAEAHNNLGIAFFRLGQYQQAERAFQRAIAIRPDYEDEINSLQHVRKELSQSSDTPN